LRFEGGFPLARSFSSAVKTSHVQCFCTLFVLLKKILVIDDEDDINLALKVVLENDGFEVTTFNGPLEALRDYKANLYDLVLLDIRMPTMDGPWCISKD
jgi:PleD family two-component response regulator